MLKQIKIENSVDLWREIKRTAQFDTEFYDKNLLRYIRKQLHLPKKGEIEHHLCSRKIPSGKLLYAVLKALEPLSSMLNDLYKMFEEASAQYGDYNLWIKLHAMEGDDLYEEYLSHFREQSETVQKDLEQATQYFSCSIAVPKEPQKLLEDINHLSHDYCDMVMNLPSPPDDISSWLEVYDSCRALSTWPDDFPQQPLSGFPEVDRQVAILWNLFREVMCQCRKNEYPGITIETSHQEGAWIGKCVHDLATLIELIRFCDVENYGHYPVEDVHQLLERHPLYEAKLLYGKQVIEFIFNLPFWKRRYELYAVWVSTQIVKALHDKDIRFHVQDNTLSFTFGGSHIATCQAYSPPLEIWTELRTPYISPKTGRRHIQPDYTLAIADVNEPENSVVLVECKQYKRYNGPNFVRAAEDYAAGRPNAGVILVNYGSIPCSLDNRTDPVLKPRIHYIGQVTPCSSSTNKFRDELLQQIKNYYR